MGKLKVFGSVGALIFGNLGLLKKAETLAAAGRLDERDRLMSEFADRVCEKLFGAAKIEMQIDGAEKIPAGTCVFIANHQSIFDALVMLAFVKNNRPCGFIMKKEHEKIPLARRWCTQLSCVFVDRENPREGVRALKAAEENLARGVSMVVFPEGTRTKDYPRIGEFKNGAFKIAQSGKYPIVPVVLFDAGERFEAAGKITGGTIHMKVLDPVTLTGTDRKEYKRCAAELEEKFRAEIEEYFKF
ncbi:MAG: 1-acyl-sn-glycerol-3-phosphate acyltransferase [Clostridia bacterium]|nr:1-acyl-sn-glycerol-3-phosphate acyltransferase [Clostridia bacterium]MBR5427314.1 1-acyl-sn-glycerol-3-phosphate acyltransferase [Clostridia bacterium]